MDASAIVLDNGAVHVEFDREHGRMTRLRHAALGIDVVTEPRLAENFRLLLPLPGWRGHYVLGREQRLADAALEGGDQCRLSWRGLRSRQGHFDIDVTQTILLGGDDLTSTIEIVNRSGLEIEEVANIVLGGLANPGERHDWRIHFADAAGKGTEWPVYDAFPGTYLGPSRPVWLRPYPGGMAMPWLDIYHAGERKGFYLGNHDPDARLSAVWAELTPCTTYGGPDGATQRWPDPRHAGSAPVGMALSWNSFPFIAPGGRWAGPPVALHFHRGTWRAAADHFRAWFDTRQEVDKRGSWLNDEDAWQSTIISYPEGTVGYRFRDLPELARRAKAVGVNVLQIDGWDIGGIDRDYPRYTPDPRLGTWDELREALAECHAMGVHVLLFSNLQWVSVDTAWYANELHRYVVHDPFGNHRAGMGWEYNTTLGLLNQTIHRMVMANPGHPEYRRIILDQLQNVVRLGAHGTQIDKLLGMAEIDYSPANTGPRDGIPRAVLDTLAEYLRVAREHDPDFRIATEAHWDKAMPYVDASYSRFFARDHLPTFQYTFPEFRQSCCITGDWDYGLVNNCLRFGHIINIEARCLHGDASDVPDLARYVSEALRVRRSIRDRIWDSRLVDPALVDMSAPDSVFHALHRGTRHGALTLVANHFADSEQCVDIAACSGSTGATVYRPFRAPERVTLPASLPVPRDEFLIVAFG